MRRGPTLLVIGAAATSVIFFLVLRTSDSERVRKTVDAFEAAAHRNHFETICHHYITRDLRERLRLLGECPTVLRRSTATRAVDLEVESVTVRDGEATARVETVADGRAEIVEVRLAKEDGGWRLATLW